MIDARCGLRSSQEGRATVYVSTRSLSPTRGRGAVASMGPSTKVQQAAVNGRNQFNDAVRTKVLLLGLKRLNGSRSAWG
jgi:hypothetical protein